MQPDKEQQEELIKQASTLECLNTFQLPNFKGQPDDFGLQQDGTFKLQLTHPIDLGDGGESKQVLTFRRPLGKDVRKFPKEDTVENILNYGADLCLLTSLEVDRMDGRDAMKIVSVAQLFIARLAT